MVLPAQPGVGECELAELADAVRLAGGDDVVIGLLLLQHEVHGAHVVAGESPVALGVEVAQRQLLLEAELDLGHSVGDLAGDELHAAAFGLVVEQYPRRRVQVI